MSTPRSGNLWSTPLANLDPAIRLCEGNFVVSLREVAQGSRISHRLTRPRTLSEFTKYVARPKSNSRVRYIVLAVNKMDLWADEYATVMNHYGRAKFLDRNDGGKEKTFADKLEELAGKVGITAHKIQVTGVSAYHNNFKRIKPTVASFDRQATEDSVRILKGFLAGMMIEGGI